MIASPKLSIVVASQGSPDVTEKCLQSLTAQQAIEPENFEIIVAEGPPYQSGSNLSSKFPRVRFLQAHSSAIPTLHGLGIDNASAPLVGITEGHCTFPNNWADTAMQLHNRSDAPAIGGTVVPGPELDEFEKALFLCDYAQFLPPKETHADSDLPGNNVVFKRSAFESSSKYGTVGFWKTFHCIQLENKGETLMSEPSLTVIYNRKLKLLDILKRRLNHGRCFGAMRADSSTALKRCVYFISGPLLPPLLVYKLYSRCKSNPSSQKMFAETAPISFLFLLAWSFGEWIGNLAGAGDSCNQL